MKTTKLTRKNGGWRSDIAAVLAEAGISFEPAPMKGEVEKLAPGKNRKDRRTA